MNFKTTGLLLTLLIIAIGVGWLFFSTTAPDEPAEPAGPGGTFDREEFVLRPQPKSDTIVRVTVEHAGRRRLVFERSPRLDQPEQMDRWVALEPLEAPVQDYMVSNLVRTFTDLKSRARFEVGAEGSPSEADAGISPANATVTLVDRDGKEHCFEVGQKAAMSNDTYVRVAGTTRIHVAMCDLLAETRRDFNQYRDKQLMALKAADVVRVEIRTQQQTCVLVRGEDQAWMIEEPVKAHAAGDEVQALVRRIAGLRAQEFAEDAPASLTRYGLDRPHVTVMVTTETPREVPPEAGESAPPPEPRTERFALAVGGFADREQEQRFAKPATQPWVVRVSQTDVEGLMPDLGKLRDPKITRLAANDATRLELTADGVTVTLEKVDDRWQGAGDLAALEIAAVTDLLEAFEELSAIDYAGEPSELAAYGLDQPRAVVTVTAGDSPPVTVRVGDVTRSARNAYVLREGQPTVFVVAAAQAARLAVPPLSLRSRSIFTADERAIVRLDLVRGPTHYVLEREEKRWQMSEPAGAPVSSEGVRVLVGNLSRLRARRVAGKGDDARFGIDHPVVTLRFAIEQPGPMPSTAPGEPQAPPIIEHTLRVGWKDTVAYCRIDADPYVFELDQTVYRVLVGELIDRRLFDFQAEEVLGLTIVGPGGTLELAREEDEWKFTPDPFVKLAQKKVSDFVGELANLRVESYIEYHDADLEVAGLSAAPVTVTIRLSEQRSVMLKLEQERAGGLPLLAGWVEQRRTFRLRQADCERLLRGVDYYLTPEAREPQTPPGPGFRPSPPRP